MIEVFNFIQWRLRMGGDVSAIIRNQDYYFEKLNNY